MKHITKTWVVLVALLLTLGPLAFTQTGSDQKDTGKSLVNINTASQSDLERLPGIGPSLAKRIVDFRQKNGNFKATSDLIAVQGIGEKKYEQLKHLITVK